MAEALLDLASPKQLRTGQRTFLNRPDVVDHQGLPGEIWPLISSLANIPNKIPIIHKRKAQRFINLWAFLKTTRQRPTFPQPRGCSIIGPGGLNFRVRNGNGWNPSGMVTEISV